MKHCYTSGRLIFAQGKYDWIGRPAAGTSLNIEHDASSSNRRRTMKTWTKPAVREQEVGLEVTSYLPAEIDVI